MYEDLTAFLPKLQKIQYGTWVFDEENDGSSEHPIQMPYVSYEKIVHEFVDAVYQFVESHAAWGLKDYQNILAEAHITWGGEAMENADVSLLDGRTVVALILGVCRGDRFCEGALLHYLEKGIIAKWLARLKEFDEAE